MNAEFVSRLDATGMTPAAYQEIMERQAALDPADFEGLEAERVGFAPINLQRTQRIRRTWKPSVELAGLVAGLAVPQWWMVLTEPWCGDSAQILPCLETLAAENPRLTLKILARDDNLDIMDNYLTNGNRGIPILVAFAEDGTQLFRWGPRPAEAQQVMDAGTAEGLDKPAKLERLHLFYGRNRGRALDNELTALLNTQQDGSS